MQKDIKFFSNDALQRQVSIRNRCFHPTGIFTEFEKEATEQSIPDRFEQQVRRYPEQLAIKTKNHSVSYAELNKAANRIARAILRQRGEKEEPVALLFGHDTPMVASILGVLKAGKMYVPLDSSYPRARLEYILEDSQAGLLLTNNRNLRFVTGLSENKHQLMNIDTLDAGLSEKNIRLSLSPGRPIYILYTSGSTGTPKGVVQNHRHRLHDIMISTWPKVFQ